MSHRLAQIESTLKRAIAEVLQRRVNDPRIQGMVSITRMKISPDMKEATAYVSVIPKDYEKRTIGGLQSAQRHIQAQAGKLVAFDMPHLRFRLDEGLKKEADVYAAIREATERTGPPEAPPPPPPEGKAINDEAAGR